MTKSKSKPHRLTTKQERSLYLDALIKIKDLMDIIQIKDVTYKALGLINPHYQNKDSKLIETKTNKMIEEERRRQDPANYQVDYDSYGIPNGEE